MIALPDIIIYGALDGVTRAYQVENLVTSGITDKAPYLSKANVMLVISFYIVHFLIQSITRKYTTPALIPMIMHFACKPASNYLWKWIDRKRIQCELRLMRIQCERKQCELIRFQCALLS